MNVLRSIGRWIADRLKDLLYGDSNAHAELGRVVVAMSGLLMGLATAWNALVLHKEIDLAALGGGLSGIIASGAVLIGAKAWSTTQHQVALSIKKDTKDD